MKTLREIVLFIVAVFCFVDCSSQPKSTDSENKYSLQQESTDSENKYSSQQKSTDFEKEVLKSLAYDGGTTFRAMGLDNVLGGSSDWVYKKGIDIVFGKENVVFEKDTTIDISEIENKLLEYYLTACFLSNTKAGDATTKEFVDIIIHCSCRYMAGIYTTAAVLWEEIPAKILQPFVAEKLNAASYKEYNERLSKSTYLWEALGYEEAFD